MSEFMVIKGPPLQKVSAELKKLGGSLTAALKIACRGWAEEVATEAKSKLTPKSAGGGQLRSSIHVKPIKAEGTRLTITFAAGGVAAPYALAVHEHLSQHSPLSWRKAVNIKWTTPGTGPKYLETPVRAGLTKLPALAKTAIENEIKKLKGIV